MDKKNDEAYQAIQGLSRRRFFGQSLAALAGTSALGGLSFASAEDVLPNQYLKIKEYRQLGRTGFKASDIGFGSGDLAEPALLEAILDAGVNYIDTAESYSRGGSERVIGQVISKRDRKKVFISTKLGLGKDATKENIIERANKSLERLQTDYVDCFMIHMPSTVEALNNPHYHAAFKELKAQGKVRFRGLSNHGSQWNDVPETMEKVALAAVEDGRFDAMLFVYNFLQRDQGAKILEACQQKRVGATLMKTNPVLNYLEMKENAEKAQTEDREMSPRMKDLLTRLKDRADASEAFIKEYNLADFNQIRNAAVKFVLSNPHVNSACLTIKNFDDLEFYVGLSGKRFTQADEAKLALYAQGLGQYYCRHACGECESQCPHGVPVNTIMRYNHYFKAQGREKTAMVKYAALPTQKADKCWDCSGQCENACPHGIPVQGLLTLAHQTLTLV